VSSVTEKQGASRARTKSSESDAEAQKRGRKLNMRTLGWLPVWLALTGYFVWLCTAMAGEAPDGIGGSSLLGILVAVIAGLVAGGLALGAGRGQGN